MKTIHNGVTITYNEDFDRFEAERGGRTFYDATLTGIKNKIDRSKKAKFVRIMCILADTRKAREPVAAEITSYDGMQARVSFKNQYGNPVKDTVYQSSLYDSTDENRALFAAMKPLQEQARALDSKVYALRDKLTRTVIQDHFDAARKAAAGEVE